MPASFALKNLAARLEMLRLEAERITAGLIHVHRAPVAIPVPPESESSLHYVGGAMCGAPAHDDFRLEDSPPF